MKKKMTITIKMKRKSMAQILVGTSKGTSHW